MKSDKGSSKLRKLSRAILCGLPLMGCGSSPTEPRNSDAFRQAMDAGKKVQDSGHATPLSDAARDGAMARGPRDADQADATARVYCWLVVDPRCLPDGGVAPGAVRGC